jgi:hypothetical protein
MSSLSGSTIIDPLSNRLTVGQIGTDGNINTRLLTISGPNSKSIVGGTIRNGINSTSIIFVLSPPALDSSPVTDNEITNTQFYIEITNAANITDISINSIRGAKVLIKPTSSIFVINNKFTIPNTINVSNLSIKSFMIIANYTYGNNIVSSIITANTDTLLKEEEDDDEEINETMVNLIKSVLPNKSFKHKKLEHFEASVPDPYFTLYWLVPPLVGVC